jgi:hypothetical protein
MQENGGKLPQASRVFECRGRFDAEGCPIIPATVDVATDRAPAEDFGNDNYNPIEVYVMV